MDFQEAIEKRTKWYEDNYSLSETAAGGDAFEDLCKFYVENGPWGKTSGAVVWKWKDPANPLRLNASNEKDRLPQDTGCDLVAQTPDGEYYVIQCKYYPNSQLTLDSAHLSNVSTLATRYSIPQKHVIFCYVAKSVSSQAESVLSHYTCFREDDLGNPDFDWAPMFGEKKRSSKELRDYQKKAIEACIEGFKAEEYEGKRQVGKLIMACGTGKTFTALGLAKKLSEGKPYTVLFMAPSIALVSQTFQAWALEEDISSLIVCSDSTAGTGKGMDEDEMDETVSDISSPDVTTDAEEMARKWKKIEGQNKVLRVVFSTYQSIEAVKEFQEKTGVKFDLTICDEAHRTASRAEANFARAAEPGYIDTVKKLFMTATPKIYSDAVKDKAEEEYATVLYSMDDEEKYGPEFYRFGFGEAVDQGVLCDYRVLILAMRKGAEELKDIQSLVKGTDAAKAQIEKLQKELHRTRGERTKLQAQRDMLEFEKKLSTLAGKIQGAYIDLSDLSASNQGEVYEDFDGKVAFKEIGGETSPESPSERHFAHSAIGFANSIRNSKIITQALSSDAFPGKDPKIECRHIDGEMKSDARLSDLLWLKQGQKNDEIRLITNAQCLSEGVDVPNLDAVVFFEKRQSQIGIIQAVGRVMRKTLGKKYGYIIIPIMLSEGETPEDMLENSDEYGVIWQVLQSMRSVDERLDAQINTLALTRKAEKKAKGKKKKGEVEEGQERPQQRSLFDEDMQKKLVSYILSKCGRSMYWDDWVGNISGSVRNMINEIDKLADTPEIRPKFEEFKDNLSKTLHKDQTKEDAVNLIAQFIVTRPVFSILFPSSDFDSNPISRALEGITDDFKDAYSAYDKELGELKFSMEQAAKAVAKDPAARKRLVKNFYEKFYQKVFPKEA
ncbi:MAG: DEAD/DEAH box helicase family protein, partial [Bifidobacteriaceae bacterium]|nr:DEAD/DEAH box helicase family protein [Bifidobacteriaceae bacterium]